MLHTHIFDRRLQSAFNCDVVSDYLERLFLIAIFVKQNTAHQLTLASCDCLKIA